jgi:hypothetical protein
MDHRELVEYGCSFSPFQKTSFANRQPDPAYQALETPVFTSDLCKDYPISQNLCIFSFHYGVQEN